MNRNTLSARIEKIQTEIPKLTHTLYALNLTDSQDYPQNYEELSTDAALRAERIACSLRNLIYAANLVQKPVLMQKTASVHGIGITQSEDMVMITLPGLMPKRNSHSNPAFVTEPLYQCLTDYIKAHELKRFTECVVCFSHLYNRGLSVKRVRDYDNLECKHILDTASAFLMRDDTGLLCDVYHCTQFGSQDCTILTIMEKRSFPKWLETYRYDPDYISDF